MFPRMTTTPGSVWWANNRLLQAAEGIHCFESGAGKRIQSLQISVRSEENPTISKSRPFHSEINMCLSVLSRFICLTCKTAKNNMLSVPSSARHGRQPSLSHTWTHSELFTFTGRECFLWQQASFILPFKCLLVCPMRITVTNLTEAR